MLVLGLVLGLRLCGDRETVCLGVNTIWRKCKLRGKDKSKVKGNFEGTGRGRGRARSRSTGKGRMTFTYNDRCCWMKKENQSIFLKED